MEILGNRKESVGGNVSLWEGIRCLSRWTLQEHFAESPTLVTGVSENCFLLLIENYWVKKVNNIITAEMPAPFSPHEHADIIYFFKEKVKTTQKIPYE